MVTICVYRKDDGKPVQGAKVSAYWFDFGAYSAEGVTDKNGQASLDVKPRQMKVLVNNREVFKGEVSEWESFHI